MIGDEKSKLGFVIMSMAMTRQVSISVYLQERFCDSKFSLPPRRKKIAQNTKKSAGNSISVELKVIIITSSSFCTLVLEVIFVLKVIWALEILVLEVI